MNTFYSDQFQHPPVEGHLLLTQFQVSFTKRFPIFSCQTPFDNEDKMAQRLVSNIQEVM